MGSVRFFYIGLNKKLKLFLCHEVQSVVCKVWFVNKMQLLMRVVIYLSVY